jgi:hypothetical protein
MIKLLFLRRKYGKNSRCGWPIKNKGLCIEWWGDKMELREQWTRPPRSRFVGPFRILRGTGNGGETTGGDALFIWNPSVEVPDDHQLWRQRIQLQLEKE